MDLKGWAFPRIRFWAPIVVGLILSLQVSYQLLYVVGTPWLFIQLVWGIIVVGALFMALLKAKPLEPPTPGRGYRNVLILMAAFTLIFLAIGFLSHQGGAAETVSDDVKYRGYRSYEIGKTLYLEKGCTRCHVIYNNGYDFSPDLSNIGVTKSREYIRAKISRPDAWTVPGYEEKHGKMPAYYDRYMTEQEIEYLVDYLSGIEQGKKMMPEWNPMYLG